MDFSFLANELNAVQKIYYTKDNAVVLGEKLSRIIERFSQYHAITNPFILTQLNRLASEINLAVKSFCNAAETNNLSNLKVISKYLNDILDYLTSCQHYKSSQIDEVLDEPDVVGVEGQTVEELIFFEPFDDKLLLEGYIAQLKYLVKHVTIDFDHPPDSFSLLAKAIIRLTSCTARDSALKFTPAEIFYHIEKMFHVISLNSLTKDEDFRTQLWLLNTYLDCCEVRSLRNHVFSKPKLIKEKSTVIESTPSTAISTVPLGAQSTLCSNDTALVVRPLLFRPSLACDCVTPTKKPSENPLTESPLITQAIELKR